MLSLEEYTFISLTWLRNYFNYPLLTVPWVCHIKTFWDLPHTHTKYTTYVVIIDQTCIWVSGPEDIGILEAVLNLKRLLIFFFNLPPEYLLSFFQPCHHFFSLISHCLLWITVAAVCFVLITSISLSLPSRICLSNF